MRRRLGGSLLWLLAVLPAGAGAQHFPPDQDLALMLRYLVEDGEAPGLALGVREADGTHRAVGYGTAGPAGLPVGPRTVFEIGSLTMTLTAALLAEMVARGDVALEDPVSRYLPGRVTLPSPGGYQITLADLATHRSGLPPGPRRGYRDLSVDDLYDIVSAADLDRPGTRYAFSPIGYGLLGHVLARAAGTPYDRLLRQRVLDPLGMAMTDFVLEAPGREGAPDSFVTEAMQGATGLRSNAEDMLRFLEANVGAPETELHHAIRRAHEIRIARGGPDEDAGYGFSWRSYDVPPARSLVAHGGETDGFTAQIHFDPARGIGTVLLANTRPFRDRIGRNLLLFQPPPSPTDVEVDRALLRRYAGTYRTVGRYVAIHYRGRHFIRLEDEGFLTYQGRRGVRTRLYPESDTSFFMLRGPYSMAFRGQGDAVRMTIRLDERMPGAQARSWTAWRIGEETPAPAVVAGNVARWRTWGPLAWAFVALVAVAFVAIAVRLITSRRVGTGRARDRAAWGRPGMYP